MTTVIGMHVGVKARDPERTAEFYKSVFDLEQSNKVDDERMSLLFLGDADEHHRMVFEKTVRPIDVSTVNQISFKLPDEKALLDVKKRIEDWGLQIEAGPFLHRKYPNDSGSLSMYFHDPEGYWIECYVPKENLSGDIEDRYEICPW